jgi:CubicO group peptidase (beta-lactamase class C family)
VSAGSTIAAALAGEAADEAVVTAALDDAGVPALAAALQRGGEVVAERSWGAPAGALFQVASISKPIAATAALVLVDQGLLSLDDDIATQLRRWSVPAVGGWQPRITLRQLLSHTAGLTVSGFPGYPRTGAVPDLVDVTLGRAATPAVEVHGAPGLRFAYSGGGYAVLQLLVEDVTGTPLPALLRELVFEPCEMTSTSCGERDDEPVRARGALADGTPVEGGWRCYPETAAAGVWSAPGDLLRWAAAVQRSASGAGPLPVGAARALLTPQPGGWGLGPRVSLGGPARYGHTGVNTGFLSVVDAAADDGTGVAVVVSGGGGGPLLRQVVDAVAEREAWPATLYGTPAERRLLESWTGTWELPTGPLSVTLADDGLALHLPGQPPAALTVAGPYQLAGPAGSGLEVSRDPGDGLLTLAGSVAVPASHLTTVPGHH